METAHRIISRSCSHHRLFIDDTFKDPLQEQNNTIQLEKDFSKKKYFDFHTIFMCRILIE